MKLTRLNSHDFNAEHETPQADNHPTAEAHAIKNFSNTGGFHLQSHKKLSGGARIKVAVRIRPLLSNEVHQGHASTFLSASENSRIVQ